MREVSETGDYSIFAARSICAVGRVTMVLLFHVLFSNVFRSYYNHVKTCARVEISIKLISLRLNIDYCQLLGSHAKQHFL